ncbi:MAG: methyltransferase domain-containing protein [Phycisphaerae bacterium]
MTQWNPQDYHQHSSQQQQWAREQLSRLALRGNEAVLDIGCGDGKITAQIARAVTRGQAVGIDTSADMITFAQRVFPASIFPNLRFQLGDAQTLDFNAEFDCVVSFACLHWVSDHSPVLAGIVRSLRPGGRTMLQFGGKGNAAKMLEAVMEITQRPKWADYFVGALLPWGFYSPEQYRPWLAEAGLQATRVELVPKDMVHHGPNGLAAWLRTTWMPVVQRVPVELQQEFLGEVVVKYLKTHPADASGMVHLNMMRMEVEAVKAATA